MKTIDQLMQMDVTDADEARAWIQALVDNGLIWHLEDDPSEVINGHTGEPLFRNDDDLISRARIRVDQCFRFLRDPFDVIVDCEVTQNKAV